MTKDQALKLMKAPGDYRPTWRGGVIQIHITRSCDLSCTGCTQGSNLAGKPVMMTPWQFEIACESLHGYDGVVGIFGGNPTLHPDFEAICEIFQKGFPFEQRGLWSNNLNGHGELCKETFNPAFSNLNVHTSEAAYIEMRSKWPASQPKGLQDSRHSPPFVALKDMEDMDDSERWRLIAECDINQYWSAMIGVFRGDLRAWFCELAGAQSMLHSNDLDYPDTGLRVGNGWWKHAMSYYEPQVTKHCMECGIPLRGVGDLAVTGTAEFVSETHRDIFKLKKPNGKIVHLIKSRRELGLTLFRATDYVENGFIALTEV